MFWALICDPTAPLAAAQPSLAPQSAARSSRLSAKSREGPLPGPGSELREPIRRKSQTDWEPKRGVGPEKGSRGHPKAHHAGPPGTVTTKARPPALLPGSPTGHLRPPGETFPQPATAASGLGSWRQARVLPLEPSLVLTPCDSGQTPILSVP